MLEERPVCGVPQATYVSGPLHRELEAWVQRGQLRGSLEGAIFRGGFSLQQLFENCRGGAFTPSSAGGCWLGQVGGRFCRRAQHALCALPELLP